MVKLIVIARCIPEDVYLAHGDQLPAVAGKKFSVVVREPESWYIGRLAVEIQYRYEALYRRPLGQIKYLKDAEDDCDLDLELTVSDLLVNEGKALKDGSDQKRIVLVVVDQGRAVRQGSVVPDLTPIHYQPAIRPPVPKFPGVEKRIIEEPEQDIRPPKRRRLDQIEEDEGEEVVHSIEGTNGINGSARGRRSPSHFEVPGAHFLSALDTRNVDRAAAEIKRESPGPHFWANNTPATRDELELLPQRPENWQHQQRGSGPPASRLQRSLSGQESVRQQHPATMTTPITPGATNQPRQSSSANAINTLNGLKSISPALRQSLSSSASRIRLTKKNVYDVPESDVDDSQMSPDSKAGRKPITPKLVKTPRSMDTNSAPKNTFRSTLLKKPATERGLSDLDNTYDESTLLADGTETMDHDLPRDPMETSRSDGASNNLSWGRAGFSKLGEAASHGEHQEPVAPASNQDGSESDEESSRVEEENNSTGHESKSATSARRERSKNGAVSTSRSSSVASSASGTGRSTSSRSTGKRLTYTKDRQTLMENEDDETLDSPGVQLEETLRQSSPFPRKSTEPRSRSSASKTASRDAVNKDLLLSRNDNEDEEDIARSPDSVSDFEEAVKPAKASKETKRKTPRAPSRQTVAKADGKRKQDLRCYTCWSKHATCDNAKPKCNYCLRWKKNCQIYSMTKTAAAKEKEDRKLGKSAAPRPVSRGSSASARRTVEPFISDEVVSASNRDDESEAEEEDDNDAEEDEKELDQVKAVINNGKTSIKSTNTASHPASKSTNVAGASRQKKKIDKRRVTGDQGEQSSDDVAMSGQESELDNTTAANSAKEESRLAVPIVDVSENRTEKSNTEPRAPIPKKPAETVEAGPSRRPVAADLETQCAVILSTGQPCLRNLNCKTHKVAEKRAVPGRARPFDALLKELKQRGKESVKEPESYKISNTKQNPAGDVRQQIKKQEPGPSPETIRTSVVQEKSIESGSVQNQSVKAPSVEGRAPSSVRTIPSGMTEEEFDRLVRDRSALTEEERKNKNLVSRKSVGPHKDTSPLVVRTQGSQDAVDKSKKATSSIKSDDKVTSSSQASGKRRQAPASTQPGPNAHVFANATTPGPLNTIVPKSAPSKTSAARNAAADARLAGRLKTHPVVANTAAALDAGKHANPPYRQPLRKSLLVNAASGPNADLGTARSLKQLKETLRSSGSGASTPQPQSAKNRTAMLNSDVKSKKGFEMSDEEDDESTESEEESPVKEETRPKGLQTANSFTAVNGQAPRTMNGVLNVIVRRREPTADDSDDRDDADW